MWGGGGAGQEYGKGSSPLIARDYRVPPTMFLHAVGLEVELKAAQVLC
jgi:hypothetical protein